MEREMIHNITIFLLKKIDDFSFWMWLRFQIFR